VMEVHEYFRLKKNRANEIIENVKSSVCNWRDIADKYNISKVEQDLKAKVFSLIM